MHWILVDGPPSARLRRPHLAGERHSQADPPRPRRHRSAASRRRRPTPWRTPRRRATRTRPLASAARSCRAPVLPHNADPHPKSSDRPRRGPPPVAHEPRVPGNASTKSTALRHATPNHRRRRGTLPRHVRSPMVWQSDGVECGAIRRRWPLRGVELLRSPTAWRPSRRATRRATVRSVLRHAGDRCQRLRHTPR